MLTTVISVLCGVTSMTIVMAAQNPNAWSAKPPGVVITITMASTPSHHSDDGTMKTQTRNTHRPHYFFGAYTKNDAV